MTRAGGSRSAPPPLAAQQDAWQTFQRRSLDGNLERRASTESRSASPLQSLSDGFDASPRPRQRRSLDVNRWGHVRFLFKHMPRLHMSYCQVDQPSAARAALRP